MDGTQLWRGEHVRGLTGLGGHDLEGDSASSRTWPFLVGNVDLLLETERGEPDARLHTGAYASAPPPHGTAARHVPHGPVAIGHVLLAGMSADLYLHITAVWPLPEKHCSPP